jgi:hypothetical protein
MAATTRRAPKKTTASKAKPAPAPEVEEDEELELEADDTTADDADEVTEDDELEELEEDEVEETKPASKKASASSNITFGIRDLVELIKAETGQETTPRAIRVLIRKMARDESGRVNREIKAGNKERYNWTGPNDAEVRAIVEAFKGGELDEEKKAKLAALKEQKAAKLAAEAKDGAKKPAAKKTAAKKAKPAPVEEVEDDEELDFDEE